MLSQAADPFGAYHQAIEQQLATISDQFAKAPEKPAESTVAIMQPDSSATIDAFARRFWNGSAANVRDAIDRLSRYRGPMESILDQEGVPRSLVAVVLIESGARPSALSPKEARGLWQFIPATARQYGLIVTPNRDERVDLDRATRAAARFLRDLYVRFGDWKLALAAYNAGPDAIGRALQRGRGSTYADISAARLIPEETRNYVPAVLSAMDLLGMQVVATPSSLARVQTANIVYAPTSVSN